MKDTSSYKSILKSTYLIGGSQLINVFFNIIRSKAIAIFLGPSGIGLIGAYNSIIGIVEKIAGLGIPSSSVREIAKSNNSCDQWQLGETIGIIKKILLFNGLFGTLILLIFSKAFSTFTFGTDQYTIQIRIISIVVFFNILTIGHQSLLQGMRQIKNLAKLSVFGAFFSTLFSVPIIYYYKENGIIPFLILVAITQFIIAWLYSRRIKGTKIHLSFSEIMAKSKSLIHLGLALMGGGLATFAALYLIRVLIIRIIDIEAAGFYTAATTLSTIYINIILNAMAKDFYPRLTESINSNAKTEKTINEQIEIGISIAAPGLLFTLGIAPFFIKIFYSSEFAVSHLILQWMIPGVFLKVLNMPLGYFFVVKGESRLYLYIQLVVNIVHIGLVFVFLKLGGIIATGFAFLSFNFIHTALLLFLIRKDSPLQMSKAVKQNMLIIFSLFTLSFLIILNTSQITAAISLTLLSILVLFFFSKKIMKAIGISNLNELLKIIISKFKK